MKRIIRAVVMVLLFAPGMLWADDFDAALEAYDAGDIDTAYEIWRPMAEQGDAEAQWRLGHIYRGALGAPGDHWSLEKQARRDDAEAVRWYRLAAEQGHVHAQMRVGSMYYFGQGVARDNAEAVRWYRAAAEQGNVSAQMRVGWMYRQGLGVIQDYSTAHMWFNIAARIGDFDAVHARDIIADLMTPEAIAEAQSRARACIESGYQDCD